jgi:4-amino-4-deoxy-L-arabinose transferase-like glycosyltransferase
MGKIQKNLILLVLIVILAFVLRFYKVASDPPSLNWDEVSIGYNAYSILKTGRDEWGQFLPIHFKSYGEYKLPMQIYASIPAIAVFGLNDFSVRITPVIYGTLTVLALYFLTYEISKNRNLSLIASFFLAISPWHIQLTRASFEASFALFWVVLGMLYLVKGFNKSKYWILSSVLFAIAMYTYNSARGFIPLFALAITPFYFKDFLKAKKNLTIAVLIFAVLMIPIAAFLFSGEGSARYKLVSVTDEAGLIPRIEQARNMSNLPQPFKNLIYNRYSFISFYVARNYLAHFTPDFLFISGAGHKQHHPQGIGELYWIQAPLILLGLYELFKKKNRFRWILIVWLVTAFIPVAFTQDSIPHALRTLNAAAVYQIITAFGTIYAFGYLWKENRAAFYLLLATFFGLLLFQFARYQYNFYTQYPVLYSRDWQYGNKQAVEYIKENYDKYDLIVYTREYGEPHMFTLFYLNYPPVRYQNSPNLIRFETNDWVWVSRFDKFYFPDLGDPGSKVDDVKAGNPGKRILFIATPQETPSDIQVLREIDFLNGQRAFNIF